MDRTYLVAIGVILLTTVLLVFRGPIEASLRWFFHYPAYSLQLVLMILVASGGLGADLGLERLFWHEKGPELDTGWPGLDGEARHFPAIQLGVGIFVGMHFGVVLTILYLLRRPVTLSAWLDRSDHKAATSSGIGWTYFPSRDPAIRSLGRFLCWGLTALLLIVVILKLVGVLMAENPWEYLESRKYLVPFAVGYGLSMLVGRALHHTDEYAFRWRADPNRRSVRIRILECWGQWMTKRLATLKVLPGDHALHAMAVYIWLVACAILAVMLALILVINEWYPGKSLASPVVVASIVLIVLGLPYGALARFFHHQVVILGGTILVLVLWNSTSANPENHYKLRFPGLSYDRDKDHQLVLSKLWDSSRTDEARDVYQSVVLPKSAQYASDKLVLPLNPLQKMDERWRTDRRWADSHRGQKPKIFLIATSGGGIRAAVWTAAVLDKLETDMPGGEKNGAFRDHVRMFTGASGGMVAAALYAADFEHGPVDKDNRRMDHGYADLLARDSLTRTVQTAVTWDLTANVFSPTATGWDRGQMLERKWNLDAQAMLGRQPLAATFQQLREKEATGLRPSIIFSPMMIEDSRRLLVSNLDLGSVPDAKNPDDKLKERIARDLTTTSSGAGLLSRSAIEFHRLFPDAPPDGWEFAHSKGFSIGTAARMSATFPVISPAVSLPTDPPRRLVDAGYYDNYGADLAAMWLLKNRDWVRNHTAGVCLIEIRAFPLSKSGTRFANTDGQTGEPTEGGGWSDLFTGAVAAVSAPLDAILNARGNACYYRNNELVELLYRTFNDGYDDQFFANMWFELDRPAAMNWYIPEAEKKAIYEALNSQKNQEAASLVRDWFGTGGVAPRYGWVPSLHNPLRLPRGGSMKAPQGR